VPMTATARSKVQFGVLVEGGSFLPFFEIYEVGRPWLLRAIIQIANCLLSEYIHTLGELNTY
jgi:hypothetical protein